MSRPPRSLRFCEICKQVRIFEFNSRVFHSRCTVCGGAFSRFPLQTDKGFMLTKSHPTLKFAGKKVSEPRSDWGIGYGTVVPNEIDDELDKVGE